MAFSAQSLEAVLVVGVLARLALQRRDVVTLKPTGLTTFDAPVSIALEYGASHGGPAAGIQEDVMAAHALFEWSATVRLWSRQLFGWWRKLCLRFLHFLVFHHDPEFLHFPFTLMLGYIPFLE